MATSIRSPAKTTRNGDFVLLEPPSAKLPRFKRLSARVCRNRTDIAKTLPQATGQTLWISFNRQATRAFLNAAIHAGAIPPIGQFLALTPPESGSIASLQAFVRPLVGIGADFVFLPAEELCEVLAAPEDEKRDLFIGGRVDDVHRAVVLVRGDLRQIVAPVESFKPNRVTSPDPSRFSVSDFGGSVCLGDYEASNHSILYEIDPDYRRRFRAKRRAEDKTFGASLGRLRRLKGLSRADFKPISEKQMARLERDEIAKPHAKTLATIAARLGVRADEIEGY